MKRNDFIETEYDKFFDIIDRNDFTPKKQLTTFFKWCFDNGFLDNLSRDDIDTFYEEPDSIYLPLLTNHKITIGINLIEFSDHTHYCKIGIDPSKCFDKVSKCSIVEEFPITSRREEDQFYRLLNSLLDKKSDVSKDWFKNAASMWYGEYHNNQ